MSALYAVRHHDHKVARGARPAKFEVGAVSKLYNRPLGGFVRQALVGESFVLKLAGNPSTGYVWRVNTGGSENLTTVSLQDIGFSSREPQHAGNDPQIVGAPQAFNIL